MYTLNHHDNVSYSQLLYNIIVVSNDIMAGKVPGETHNNMESCRFLIVILSWILSVTEGNQSSTSILC